MEEGTVLDYLMASAAFPGLEQTVIGGKSFIDGGIVDNMPYNMALARGYRNIILVDISGMGINRKPDITGTKTVYIKNSVNMGWVFDFSRPFLERFRTLGYLDTMKAFGRLKGERYFIRPDHRSERIFRRYIKGPEAARILDYYLPEEDHSLPPEVKIRKLLPESMRQNRDLLYCLADCAASSFQLDRFREYSLPELARAVRDKRKEEDEKIRSLKESMTPSRMPNLARNLELLFKEVRERDGEQDSPYYDYLLCTEILEWGRRLLVRGLMHYYKELPAGLLTADFLGDFR
jgi:NTE family protein